ncbi:hypothetical protein GCM10009648_34750 [Tsukamurella spumae]
MEFEGSLLPEPDHAGDAVDDRVEGLAVGVVLAAAADPRGRVTRQPLLEEGRLVDPVGPALAGERAAGQVGERERGDGLVVVDDLGLGGAGGGVEHLVQVGQLHGDAVDLAVLPDLRHGPIIRLPTGLAVGSPGDAPGASPLLSADHAEESGDLG